jgi:hypothetical protein
VDDIIEGENEDSNFGNSYQQNSINYEPSSEQSQLD